MQYENMQGIHTIIIHTALSNYNISCNFIFQQTNVSGYPGTVVLRNVLYIEIYYMNTQRSRAHVQYQSTVLQLQWNCTELETLLYKLCIIIIDGKNTMVIIILLYQCDRTSDTGAK